MTLLRRLRLLSGLVCCWLLGLGQVPSGLALDLYSEHGIEVDVTADSAVEAQRLAILEAQQSGLKRLLLRLAAPEDRDRLPEVETLAIETFVRGYAVEEEKRSPTRYLGTLTVHYRPEAIRDLLERQGIAAVLEPSQPLLLLPVVEDETGARLAGEADPWRLAWLAELDRNTVTSLVLPLGDLSDIAATGRYLQTGDAEWLRQLADRYGLAAVALARARISGRDQQRTVQQLELTLTTSGAWPEVREQATLIRAPGEDSDRFWRRAAVTNKGWLDAAWKRDNLVRVDLREQIAVVVPLADLAGWLQIRRGLESVPEIQRIELVRLSREQAEVELEFIGGIARLEQRLAERGLQADSERGRWRLRPVAAGEER